MIQSKYITTAGFLQLTFNRFKKFRYVIISSGILVAIFLGIYTAHYPVLYTSTATIFSLTSSNDNPATSSAISLLLGAETNKSFSDETSINIIELAQSRAISEAVAAVPVPSMQNKTIAGLLIDDINTHKSFFQKTIKPPVDEDSLVTFAASILRSGLTASINKNNSFILNYTGRSEDLVKIISYIFIDKISQFYIDIKRDKANRDFEFATSKVDSLRRVMGAKDYMLIAMDKRTLFTNTDKMEYRVPTQNLEEDKQLIHNQYSQAVINQQTAAYKLQKETPMVKVLDKPDPPFDTNKRSVILYSLLGFLAGSILAAGLVIFRLFIRFTSQEILRAFTGNVPSQSTTTTASAL